MQFQKHEILLHGVLSVFTSQNFLMEPKLDVHFMKTCTLDIYLLDVIRRFTVPVIHLDETFNAKTAFFQVAACYSQKGSKWHYKQH